ncbi:3-oxoacyl-ACP synthase [Winogradskyella ouciana]|uniref:3-oxoacyl-ACP synthase n=1 Tax=Winogradskyella ouciana TaxID=2608631 RepID=A0A7K1GDC1_9FLAO|nr:3-oxoacyl-ACP synthase [Winogradskyella ouciana]MTE27133.1 3-oxoacyl-ACP synthase [Winogradskyella ouciana]
MNTKQQLYNKCKSLIDNRLKVIQNSILDIQNALQSETKSSAGDKHETGRAMLQLEREKAGQQLAEIQMQFELLNKINPETIQNTVALGSVVYTPQSNYFLAISVGEIKIDEQCFFAISPVTPIGKLLMSKAEGDKIQFKNQEIKILKVL